MSIRLVIVAAFVLATPVGAAASGSFGQACYQAAAFDWPVRQSLDICKAALRDRGLSTRDRGATLVNRGVVELRARDYVAAVADFDAALVVVPDLADALVNKGIAQADAGHPVDAIASLTAALAANTARPEIAYYMRAMANEDVGATGAAYDDYRRAAALAPEWTAPADQLRRFSVVRRATALG
jgi:tetratricopeptide (TPR) repeat protein